MSNYGKDCRTSSTWGGQRLFLAFSAFFVNWLGPFDLDDETKLRHQVVTSCIYSRYMLKHVLFLTLFCPSLLLILKIGGKMPFAPLFHSLSTHFSGHFCLENEFLPPFIGVGLANGST